KIAEYGNKVYEFTEDDPFWETETGIIVLNRIAKSNEDDLILSKKYYNKLLPLLKENFFIGSQEYIGTLFSYSLVLKKFEEYSESLQLLRQADSLINTYNTNLNYHTILKKELASVNYQIGNLRESNNI